MTFFVTLCVFGSPVQHQWYQCICTDETEQKSENLQKRYFVLCMATIL